MSRNALVGILFLFVAAFVVAVVAFPPPPPQSVPEHRSALDLIQATSSKK